MIAIDAGIYHNGALIYDNGYKIDAYQIDNPKEIVDKILSFYPNTSIAVESNDNDICDINEIDGVAKWIKEHIL